MIREVVRYPDSRLKTVCEPVGGSGPLEGAAAQLAQDLLDTMATFPGCVGIAAPQLGELVRMFAIDVTGHKRAKSCHGRLVLVDPVVVARSGNVSMREGCLSIPDFTGNVRRAEKITLEARVALHELDHLDGLLFLDRVRSAKDVFPRKHYQ